MQYLDHSEQLIHKLAPAFNWSNVHYSDDVLNSIHLPTGHHYHSKTILVRYSNPHCIQRDRSFLISKFPFVILHSPYLSFSYLKVIYKLENCSHITALEISVIVIDKMVLKRSILFDSSTIIEVEGCRYPM